MFLKLLLVITTSEIIDFLTLESIHSLEEEVKQLKIFGILNTVFQPRPLKFSVQVLPITSILNQVVLLLMLLSTLS